MVDAMEAGAKQGFNRAFHEGMERAVREGIEQAMKLLRKDHRRRYSPGRSALTRTLVQHIPGLDAVCMAGVAAQAWSLCDFGYVEQIRRERDDSKRKDTY